MKLAQEGVYGMNPQLQLDLIASVDKEKTETVPKAVV